MTAHVIVVGNEKGGTGKSTVAMHLATYMLRGGMRVATLDLDARQASLTRYLDNRRQYAALNGLDLPLPLRHAGHPIPRCGLTYDHVSDPEALEAILNEARATMEAVLIDTPGSDQPLSRIAHSYADTLVTPLNDSLIDLDVLARVDAASMRILHPSHYAEMVWDAKKKRARLDGGSINWIVMRNRLSHLDAHNKQTMEQLLEALAKRIGFHFIPGLGERVIYRELFLKGLTLLDIRDAGIDMTLSMSHLAARQELRMIAEALGLVDLAGQQVA